MRTTARDATGRTTGLRLAGAVLGVAVGLAGASGAARAASILTQFQGGNLSQSGFVPSDMGGSVGGGYVMQMLNGVVSTYTTAGAAVGSAQSANAFWTGAGAATAIGTTSASDPRLVFDPATQRWFASAISTQAGSNNILVAVSKFANPTLGFTALSIPAVGTQFADFPTLGVNGAGVTIGTNNFTSSTGTYVGSSVYSIPKADLTGVTPTLANLSTFANTNQAAFTPQPVTNGSGAGTTTSVLSTGVVGTTPVYALSTVTGANGAGATLGLTTSYSSGQIANAALLNTPLAAPTQPGATSYDPGDSRISSGAYQAGNNIYFANTVANAVTGATSNNIAWSVLNATSTAVVASGTLTIAGQSLSYPSISASSAGTFVVAFTGSGSTTNITDYYVICSAITAMCGAPQVAYISPASNYNLVGGGRNRWGDYSSTIVDPTNPNNFWLFQQYASTNTSWATVITQIGTATLVAAPEPTGVGLFAIALLSLGLTLRRARVSRV